jgi:hypothetical protein
MYLVKFGELIWVFVRSAAGPIEPDQQRLMFDGAPSVGGGGGRKHGRCW